MFKIWHNSPVKPSGSGAFLVRIIFVNFLCFLYEIGLCKLSITVW